MILFFPLRVGWFRRVSRSWYHHASFPLPRILLLVSLYIAIRVINKRFVLVLVLQKVFNRFTRSGK